MTSASGRFRETKHGTCVLDRAVPTLEHARTPRKEKTVRCDSVQSCRDRRGKTET